MSKIFFVISFTFLLSSCINTEELIFSAWQKYENKDYKYADKIFSRALFRRGNKIDIYKGKSLTNEKLKDLKKAEFYASKLFALEKNADNTFMYARITSLNKKSDIAMTTFFELLNYKNYQHYFTLAKSNHDFSFLSETNPKFERLVKDSIRILKIGPISAYSSLKDGMGIINKNDMYVQITQNNITILDTKIIENNNIPFWDVSLIIDYKLDTHLQFTLLEDDVYQNDLFLNRIVTLNLAKKLSLVSKSGRSEMTVIISDTEETPYQKVHKLRIDTSFQKNN